MVFASLIFLFLFLPLNLLLYYSTKNATWRNLILIVFSLFFYGWGEPIWITLMIFSATVDYVNGRVIEKYRGKIGAKIGLISSLIINLGLLATFKYSSFIVENVNGIFGTSFSMPHFALPIGISFYTFQTISYSVDVYRNEVKAQRSYLKFLMFVSLFHQLVAGPIVRYSHIASEIDNRKEKLADISMGISRFCIGLFKKVVIANVAAELVRKYMGDNSAPLTMDALHDLSTGAAWFGLVMFALQIYFDFSGYSDMAIGIGKMFGIRLPVNFNSPYKATSIVDFWRRWHITLSRFLKDYLYISLGGNRKGPIRRQGNLLITMLLGGLWHGASWNFVVWGGMHGSYLVVNHLWGNLLSVMGLASLKTNKIYLIIMWGITFIAVVLAWVMFRAETFHGAMNLYESMLGLVPGIEGGSRSALVLQDLPRALAMVLVGALVALFAPNVQEIIDRLDRNVIGRQTVLNKGMERLQVPVTAILMSFALVLTLSSMNRVSEFLYFQF
ncbi:MAG: MBOAT family protein [Chitinophagaceae bacterium]|nr:MBOAT family protein [Chitinophagaceae bacterium]